MTKRIILSLALSALILGSSLSSVAIAQTESTDPMVNESEQTAPAEKAAPTEKAAHAKKAHKKAAKAKKHPKKHKKAHEAEAPKSN